MNDRSPLRMAEQGHSSSPSQSSGSRSSQPPLETQKLTRNAAKPKNEANLNEDEQQRRRRRRDEVRAQRQADNQDIEGSGYRGDTGGGTSVVRGRIGGGGGDDNLHRNRSSSESTSKSGHLRYGARNVIELFIPVSLCMLIVVGTMKATDSYKYSSQTVIWYAQVMFTDQSVDLGTRVWQSVANAFIMLILIVIMTTVLILLYKNRCYTTIHGWLIMSSLILLFMFAFMYIAEILKIYNIPMDIYTISICIWNFGVVGMICIHWKGPLLLQQGYLITISALLALVFIRSLPDWTTWTVLAIVSVWDLVAVLCPRGPLRILVETAQERNEAIFPALIYSSTMMWEAITLIPSTITMAKSKRGNRNAANRASGSVVDRSQQHPVEIHYDEGARAPEVDIIQPTMSGTSDDWTRPSVRAISANQATAAGTSSERQQDQQLISSSTSNEQTISFQPQDLGGPQLVHQSMEEERGVKLGLGDFIFFSLLVGKASSYNDWTITLSCYVAILVGLCLTLSLLAVFRKALPALPISIAFGLCSFFMSYVFAVPLAETLAINQIFI